MSSENNNLPQNGGYDIDAEMKKLGISVDSDNGDYNPDQTSPVKQGGGGFTDKIKYLDRKKAVHVFWYCRCDFNHFIHLHWNDDV